mgnify:CR=1 FL=1
MYGEAAGKYPHVFSPLRVKNIIYKNRLCSTTMSTVPTHTHLSSTNYGGIGIYDKALGGVAMIGMMYHGKAGAIMKQTAQIHLPANMIWTYCASRFPS